MSSKDMSVVSKEALTSTKPGRQIIKQGLFKSKGYKLFSKYKKETEAAFPDFADRFARDLGKAISSDSTPLRTQQAFADEVGSAEMALDGSILDTVKTRLENMQVLNDRVQRILDSNFVKMTFPVFNGLFDAAVGSDHPLKQGIVEGHMLAIDLSEPMDRIIDRDEDIKYLDDYKLMNPYILEIARRKISEGGDRVISSFESGFKDARLGQFEDERLKSASGITESAMSYSYKKYRAVMGTAGKNMALAENPLGEIFYTGMAHAAESAGCGNEMEDALKLGRIKTPSWPLYYAIISDNAKVAFDLTMKRADLYLDEARLSLDLLPAGFSHGEFLEFLFLTLEHYNRFWYGKLNASNLWEKFRSDMQGAGP